MTIHGQLHSSIRFHTFLESVREFRVLNALALSGERAESSVSASLSGKQRPSA